MSHGTADSPPSQRAARPSASPPWRYAGDPPSVLVIEDGEEARDLYRECLEFHGFRTDAAADGASGLEKAFATLPDLIVLDFSMPRMDGGEVLRRLRAEAHTHAIHVVMVTAVLELVDKRVRSDCAAFLEKPCEPDRLVQTILQVLETCRRRPLGQ
ncbi:MAG: response regulator [Myxococcales bacterium]|nr:response regulator [Myxococcales bacterium]